MITAAVLCPAAPLMFAELTGDDPDAASVRSSALDAVSWLVASGVSAVAVVGAGTETREWPSSGRANLAPFGGPALVGAVPVPLGVGLGGRLLDQAAFTGERVAWTVSGPASLPLPAGRVGLLVLADGSAYRDLKTSSDVAERAFAFDAAVQRSIVDGDLAAVAALDEADLMVTGFPALRFLADAVPSVSSSSMLYCAAPFGVGYFVATLRI